ncbi:hypothetical protein ACOMHN_057808 [Nucella lapillus]
MAGNQKREERVLQPVPLSSISCSLITPGPWAPTGGDGGPPHWGWRASSLGMAGLLTGDGGPPHWGWRASSLGKLCNRCEESEGLASVGFTSVCPVHGAWRGKGGLVQQRIPGLELSAQRIPGLELSAQRIPGLELSAVKTARSRKGLRVLHAY